VSYYLISSKHLVFNQTCQIKRQRVQHLSKGLKEIATTLQEGGLTEQRNQLSKRILVWEQLLPLYIPGLLQYRSDIDDESNIHTDGHPENSDLWLPSKLPEGARQRVCMQSLPRIKEKLRTAQCYDALESIHHILKIKSRLIKFKQKNI
jgi:hypothetical protein